MAVAVNALWGLFMMVMPFAWIRWMSPDAVTAHYASDYMVIVGGILILQVTETVLTGDSR